MKAIPFYLALLFSTTIAAQSSGNFRRVQRESEKVIHLTSALIDGVMTYEKAKKMRPIIKEQFEEWRRAKRSFARLDDEAEKVLLEVVNDQLGQIIEASSGPLQDWLEDDRNSNYNYEFLSLVKLQFRRFMKHWINMHTYMISIRVKRMYRSDSKTKSL